MLSARCCSALAKQGLSPPCPAMSCAAAMSFKRFVEIGRVALITFGPEEGKLCTIVDVIDNNRVMVDGPEPITGVHRHAVNLKRIQLTDIKIPAKVKATQKYAPRRARKLHAVVAQWAALELTTGASCDPGVVLDRLPLRAAVACSRPPSDCVSTAAC